MKFAKELDQDLVPEWRMKYVNYKAGKKRIKAVSRAFYRITATPRSPKGSNQEQPSIFRDRSLYGATSPFQPRPKPSPSTGRHDGAGEGPTTPLRTSPAGMGAASDSRPDSGNSMYGEDAIGPLTKTLPKSIPTQKKVQAEPEDEGTYGSFVPTPPRRPSTFELPDPAIAGLTPMSSRAAPNTLPRSNSHNASQPAQERSFSMALPRNAYEIGQTLSPGQRRGTFQSLRRRMPSVQRMFSVGAPLTPSESRRLDVNLVAVDQVRDRQRDFFNWMDGELDKVETFYKEKEDEAGSRLKVLRDQLHEMRNRRIEEIAIAQRAKAIRKETEQGIFSFQGRRSYEQNGQTGQNGQSKKDDDYRPTSRDALDAWLDPIKSTIETAKARVTGPYPGANSKALQKMMESPETRVKNQAYRNQIMESAMDYVRRPHYNDEVPYRVAKRKLKLALQEFYRGMELLKSYALLNRTAFRKINKKYDKAVDAHPPLRYMSDKVNKAWFVQSEVLDGHLHAVEDLYARYFERGNHKIAVGKLRSSNGRSADRSLNAFQNGMLNGVGAVFAIQGVIYGLELLNDPDPRIRSDTSYLLQIYAAYFLALYLFSLFCLDCSIFTRNKINYQFIFEFDTRHSLDWRQLSEFPAFMFLLFGLFIWVNFSEFGPLDMYIYYPVILIFVSVVIVFIPAPILFHRSRRWFVYSHWRLLLAGLYPVEFRDFFLGDMYCSLTYMTSGIELFFCLYAHYFDNPAQCNSTHSRLLGFFSTLPGIWRLLQCLRRYYDTRAVFPHLVNGGKYTATILYYATLSVYRINPTRGNLALFVTFATLNAIYVSIWDLLMDWSLLQPDANKKWLRDVRGYKNHYYYYGAMILDPMLRFNWIFYAIYTADIQHSSICSFLVSFSECTRRGIWVLFRVENEHCSNVRRFKASRDVPLPYTMPSEEDVSQPLPQPSEETALEPFPTRLSGRRTSTVLEAQESAGTVRNRQASRTFTQIVADAHKQDFEKKRKPGAGDSDNLNSMKADGGFDDVARGASSDEEDGDDDDDEADMQDVLDAEGLVRERREGQEEQEGSYFDR